MNIEELINHLEKIKKEIGNVDVLFERVAYQYYDEIEYEIVPLKEENVEKKVMFSYINEVYYLTKGDANMTEDINPVKVEQIVGTYKFHLKYLGYASVKLSELFNKKESVVETG